MIKMDSLTILCLHRHICIKLVCQVSESQILAVSNTIYQALGKGAMSIRRVSVRRRLIRTRRPQSGITTLKPPAKHSMFERFFWVEESVTSAYTPEVWQGIWKWPPGKGDPFWKLSFWGSMLNFRVHAQNPAAIDMANVPGMKMIRMVFHHPKYFATQKTNQYSWLVHLPPLTYPAPQNKAY